MNVPFVVPFYAGIFALIYFFLAMRVARRRGQARIALGSGGDAELERRIRIHGNFGEYVPFILLMLGFAELQHWSRYLLHALCIVLLIGRISHAIALSRDGSVGPLRGLGMALTGAVMIIAAVMLIYEFFLVLPTI
jgi:uncharacterized membrane protein YecN with MAPEG domain